MAYNGVSLPDAIDGAETSASLDTSDIEVEQRARMQKLDAERLVDALRSLKYYTERKLAQLTGSGVRFGGKAGTVAERNGKIPGRLSSGSESDLGEATSDEDGGVGGDNEVTVELYWSRWDDSAPVTASENATVSLANGKLTTNGNAPTRHHSLSLGTTHGVNLQVM